LGALRVGYRSAKDTGVPIARPRTNAVKRFPWLRFIPGVGRLRALRPGGDALVGPLVDTFASFTALDHQIDPVEADVALDLLRNAFPEADHGWLAKRLQRAVRTPRPLPRLAAELRDRLDDTGKLALGLQLFTLVDAAGQSVRGRSSFEVFMRRLGRPEYGQAIIAEMTAGQEPADPPFEKLIFGNEEDPESNIALPAEAVGVSFRVYRAGDLVLVRNTGTGLLWVRGRSLETGTFLRMRERQQLVVPGWSLTFEDLVFFLNAAHTGRGPVIFLSRSENGLRAERTRSRQSVLRLRFGTKVDIEVLLQPRLRISGLPLPPPGRSTSCSFHEWLTLDDTVRIQMDSLRRQAIAVSGRFRLATDRREYLVSNDPSAISAGDLLLSPGLGPRSVLRIRFDPTRATGELETLEFERPVQVNGISVRGYRKLLDGDLIRLSESQAIRCRFSEGILDEERTVIRSLSVESLLHDFGPQSRALDNVSFQIERGEMLCIIGPSGSGKSTLLATLSGQLAPQRGFVRLNGISLYDNLARLRPFVAHMPQEEALNPQITVREHLRHAAAVRRPHLSPAEQERRVDSILAELSLQSLAHRKVGSPGEKALSGGERSRLNLGLDLSSPAEIFLFDEPISGLSSKDSEHVAETLRSLARDKIVIASLHRPGAQVLRLFDKVLLLDSGGRVAFFGTPRGMLTYFTDACTELGLTTAFPPPDAPLGADFVFDVLETPLATIGAGNSPGAVRRFPATFWQERFESNNLVAEVHRRSAPTRLGDLPRAEDNLPIPVTPRRTTRQLLTLFITHFQRSLLSKFRNRGTLYSTLLEAPILAFLIGITLRSSPEGGYDFSTALHIPAYLFLTATVAMFLGLTNSATEILRDRPILRRERNCRSHAGLYVFSKFAVLGLLAAIQCLTYLLVGNAVLEIRGMLFEHWLWMTLTAWTGTGMALVISSVVKSERAALTSVPLLLVPQMLLAGALVPFTEMNHNLFNDSLTARDRGGEPVPALFMPLRYAYEAMLVTQATRNHFEVQRDRIQRRIDDARETTNLSPEAAARMNLLKDGLTALLAAGAPDAATAERQLSRITEVTRRGTALDLETMIVWPERDDTRPASDFFVNQRIDLLVGEAETFRSDYRRKNNAHVFLATQRAIGFTAPASATPGQPAPAPATLSTLKFTGALLLIFCLVCALVASLIVTRQRRMTR
jgi:ABC-type multidrug transport system ATPase subunit